MNQEPETRKQELAAQPHVFVYGTLRPGGSNNFRMRGSRWVGPATVEGYLYVVDWYPALLLDENGGRVFGDLYEVPADLLASLDDFEGTEYRRVRAMVQNADDEAISAWVWEWDRETKGLHPIPSGDWLDVEPGVIVEEIDDED